MQPSAFEGLARARYVSLATFRRDGREVATPVWCAAEGDELFVFSAADAGKVKRIRAGSRARLATCDVRGGLTGSWHDASAELITGEPGVAMALRALRRKYGWQMWLADAGARLSGRFERRAYIRLRLVQ